MKRLLIIIATVLVSASASAAEVREREVLLTDDGVLYRVDGVRNSAVAEGRSQFYLVLTVQENEKRTTETVPATMTGGAHINPALAYDSDSRTLFLFWQEQLHRFSSRLLFASYRDGVWSDVSTLDSADYKVRRNLRIAVTRLIETTDAAHGRIQLPQVVVHAVWWEESASGEWARYAMLGIDNGVVTSTDFRHLVQFTGSSLDRTETLSTPTANEVLRHPAVATTPSRDAVDVVFGDATTNSLHRLRIKPTLDGRVRIPIGVRGKNMREIQLDVAADGRASAVFDEDTVAIYTIRESKMNYVMYRDGKWISQRTIALSDELSAQTAVDALRRMVVER